MIMYCFFLFLFPNGITPLGANAQFVRKDTKKTADGEVSAVKYYE